MNTRTPVMITALFFFLTFFSLFTTSNALPAPAPAALANAPASLLGRSYSYVARDDNPSVPSPEIEKHTGDDEFDKEPLTKAMKLMLKMRRR
jgi:hypothetical protein